MTYEIRDLGSSLVIDCELTQPSINVRFLISQNDSSPVDIMIDGIKYQRIGVQKLRINSLDVDDAVSYVCRVDGIRDKYIHVSIQKSKYRMHVFDGLLGLDY